jgi:hypothetical protein
MTTSRTVTWAGHVARIEMRNAYKIFVGKSEWRPRYKFRRIWESNIKILLREIKWKDINWIHMHHNRDQWRILVNMAINLRIPQKVVSLNR